MKELAETSGITTKSVRINIDKLKQKGLLRRVGPDKGGHWEVMKNDLHR